MKLKNISQLAVIGVLLNVLTYLLGLPGEFDNKVLMEYSLMITANIFMVIFFFAVLTRTNSEPAFIKSGVFGLTGYLILVILNLLGMIINATYIIAANVPGIQLYTLSISLVNNYSGTYLKLIPITLIFISFTFLWRGLNKKIWNSI